MDVGDVVANVALMTFPRQRKIYSLIEPRHPRSFSFYSSAITISCQIKNALLIFKLKKQNIF
jgi:hypothetical protein